MIRLVSTAGLQKKGQLFEKDIELVLSGVENTKECMTHSPLEVSPIRAGAKLGGGQIFQWSAFGDVGIATTWCSYNFIKGILSTLKHNICTFLFSYLLLLLILPHHQNILRPISGNKDKI